MSSMMQSLTPKRKVLKPIQSLHSLNHNHDKSHILWSRYLFQLRISMVSQKDRIEIGIARPALLCRVLRKLMNFWLLRQDFSVHIFLRLLYSIVSPFGPTIEQQIAWVTAYQSSIVFTRPLGQGCKDRLYRKFRGSFLGRGYKWTLQIVLKNYFTFTSL